MGYRPIYHVVGRHFSGSLLGSVFGDAVFFSIQGALPLRGLMDFLYVRVENKKNAEFSGVGALAHALYSFTNCHTRAVPPVYGSTEYGRAPRTSEARSVSLARQHSGSHTLVCRPPRPFLFFKLIVGI